VLLEVFNWKGLESERTELNAFPKVEELSGMNGDAAALRMRVRRKVGGPSSVSYDRLYKYYRL
jgi:hypothetical protein